MIYQEVRTQWRGGGMGIIGLDYAEVRHACKELEVVYTRGLKRKIRILEQNVLNSQNKKEDSG